MQPQPLMTVRSLFRSELIGIGDVRVEPGAVGSTSPEVMDDNAIAMPLRGVFASHFSRRRACVTTPNDAVLLGAGVPHHYSFPGGVGDHSLVLRWSAEALGPWCPQIAGGDSRDSLQFASQVSLPPRVIVERELLWRQAASGNGDPLAVEVRALELLVAILGAARRSAPGRVTRRRGSLDRQRTQVGRIKSAVAADPGRRWSLDLLARLVAVSPFHLARNFKAHTGVSIHEYVVRMRLACCLPTVLDSNDGLTDIALRAGFASHSHFTENFRARFDVTPSELRRHARKRVLRAILAAH